MAQLIRKEGRSSWSANKWDLQVPGEDFARRLVEDRLRFGSQVAQWYRSKKRGKKRLAKSVRLVATVLGSLGISYPLYGELVGLVYGDLGYLLLAIAGGLLLADTVFGISAGWFRFMATALEVEHALEIYRLRCMHVIETNNDSKNEEIVELSERLTDKVSGILASETSVWIEEFRNGGLMLADRVQHRSVE